MVRPKASRLSEAQRQELGRLAAAGGSINALAARFRCTRATVRRWCTEARKHQPQWRDAAGRGRKPALSAAERAKAKRMARHGKPATHVAASLNQQRAQPVSRWTVARALAGGRTPLQWLRVSEGRRLSPANKKRRVAFCRQHIRAQVRAWAFADSKIFHFYKDGSGAAKWEWQDPEQPRSRQLGGNPVTLHIYAVVARGHKSALFFTAPSAPQGTKQKKATANFSSSHFIEVAQCMQAAMVSWGMGDARHPLVLDHAKQHTSRASRAAMASMGMHLLDEYPPQSWDINIIENVWGMLEQQLKSAPARQPTTPDGWRRWLQQAWNAVEQSSIDKLIGGLPKRLTDIVEKGGDWLWKHK